MKKNKVFFFNRIYDNILKWLPYFLLLLLCLVIYKKREYVASIYTSISGISLSDAESLILSGIVQVFTVSLSFSIKRIRYQFKNFSSLIKHKTYPFIKSFFVKKKIMFIRKYCNKSINPFYYTDYKPTNEQNSIFSSIIDILSKKEHKADDHIVWIQGPLYSGKTITVSYTLLNIITENKYLKIFKSFDNKIFYVDFRRDDYDKFMENYFKSKYEHSILIIDNTVALSENRLINLMQQISNKVKSKLIIVLLREFSETTNDPLILGTLHDYINAKGSIYQLQSLSLYNTSLSKINDQSLLDTFLYLDEAMRFHLFKIHENNIQNQNFIYADIISYLSNYIKKDNFSHEFIFIISCFCLFTGSFSAKKILDCYDNKKQKYKIKIIISELHYCGFIDRSPYGEDEVYIFNSHIAKHYFKLGCARGLFKDTMNKVLSLQYDDHINKNQLYSFLYGCLLRKDYKNQVNSFNAIAFNTNFKAMLDEMEFFESIDKTIISDYKREIGILYDRTGRFNKSRKLFNELLREAQNNNNTFLILDTFYRLVQIDHSIYDNFKYLELLNKEIKSDYLSIQQLYWELHMKMHKGKFLLDEFVELLKKANKLCSDINYDNIHLIRRIYFDVYRIYFLEGSSCANKLLEIKKTGKNIQMLLQNYLNEFSLYYEKFTFLFLLSKDVMFNLIFDETVIEKEIFESFIKRDGIVYEDMSNKEKIIDISINTCKKLETAFEKTGDKTFNFIRYYRTELLIIQNDDSCAALIKQYRDFGVDEIEYRLYADFLELKYLISKYLSVEKINDTEDGEYYNLKLKISQQMNIIENYFSDSYSNDYARMRLFIYKVLFNIITNKPDKENLLNIAFEFAKKQNYYREMKILNRIKEFKNQYSFGWCRNVLLFYPVIPQ